MNHATFIERQITDTPGRCETLEGAGIDAVRKPIRVALHIAIAIHESVRFGFSPVSMTGWEDNRKTDSSLGLVTSLPKCTMKNRASTANNER